MIILLLALKVCYPERVWLTRGNHEVRATNVSTPIVVVVVVVVTVVVVSSPFTVD